MDVIGVGDADIDIYLDVDHIPGQDEKVLARQMEFHSGGMVANYLAAFRRLGLSCGFHGPVGDDEFGQLTLADLQANGVDIRDAVIKPGERTYFCMVMLNDSGEKALVVAPTSCLFLHVEDVSEEAILRARHIHTTAANLPSAIKVLTIAKSHGLTTSLDLEPTMANQQEALKPLLPLIDILFVNRNAALALGRSTSVIEATGWILTQGPRIVCTTMGAEGSLVATSEAQYHVEAFPVQVIDSTGAGDCYAAGFTFGFLQNWPIPRTARFASAVGALSVMGRGGHTYAPVYDDVVSFLKKQEI